MTGRTVAIVGGGLSGTLVAMRLLAQVRPPQMMRVIIVEPRPQLGPGSAYSTVYAGHLMNVRAGRLSLVNEDAEHFVKWLRTHSHSDLSPSAESFAPRFLYGRYVSELLDASQARAHPYVALRHIRAEAVDLRNRDSGIDVLLKDGACIQADAAVLALGNPPPNQDFVPDPEFRSSSGYLSDVWQAGTVVSLARDASVLLVGSGLPAIDVAVALEESGFRGGIHVVSRRGIWPCVHARYEPCLRSIWQGESFGSLRTLLSTIRREVRLAEAEGGNWRAVIDSLRPYANRLWQGLSPVDRRRFFRHLRPYWEAHRHRMAPQVARIVEGLTEQGRLRLYAGRITAATWDEERAQVQIKLRGGSTLRVLRVSRVINCAGPESDYRKLPHPLWRNLFARGMAVAGPIGMGLRVGPEGQLINAQGEPSETLFTLGPTRLGALIETTSVPEIRVQAAVLAARLHGLTESSLGEMPQHKSSAPLHNPSGESSSATS
jgi:uncharacterized NAD(P)/FAD-binding protein YdhS